MQLGSSAFVARLETVQMNIQKLLILAGGEDILHAEQCAKRCKLLTVNNSLPALFARMVKAISLVLLNVEIDVILLERFQLIHQNVGVIGVIIDVQQRFAHGEVLVLRRLETCLERRIAADHRFSCGNVLHDIGNG